MKMNQQNDTTAQPGDRIRIEEYTFGAENFLAAAYLPETYVRSTKLVSFVAVDVATGYILGCRLTLDPSAEDVSELLALVMRDKSNIARRLDNHFWEGWCMPKIIEARANGVFGDPKVTARLTGLGVEVVGLPDLDVSVTMTLASRVCVSPAAVRKFRADDEKMRKSKKIKSAAFDDDRRRNADWYLRAAVEHEFFKAICCGVQNSQSDEGRRTLRAFQEGRRQEVAPTDHELRLMLCEEIEGPVIEQDGLEVFGHIFDSYQLEELGYEIEEQPTTIKVGGWNLDAISVRNFDGTWFEVAIADDDAPAGLTRREMDFAAVMAASARLADEDADDDDYYHHHLERMRALFLPVFDPHPLLTKRHKKGSRTGMLPVMWVGESLGYVVKYEEFQVNLGDYRPGASGGNDDDVVTVYVGTDIGTGYVLSLKVASEPSAEAALDFISLMMRDRNDLAAECGASNRWPGAIRPMHLAYENGTVFDEDGDVFHALTSLEIQGLNPAVQVGVDLHALLEGEWVVPPAEGMPKGDALERCLVRLVCDVYHTTPQLILGGRTPMQAFVDASVHLDERKAPPSLKDLREAVGREIEAVIGEDGLLIEGELYNSEWLQTIRSEIGETPVKLRFDPLAAGEISVLPPDEQVAFKATWTNWQVVPHANGFSLDVTLQELRDVREALSYTAPLQDGRRTNRRPVRERRHTP